MHKPTCIAPARPLFAAFVLLTLTACSDSKNDSSEPVTGGTTPLQASAESVPDRLKTMSFDYDRDGTINEMWSYNYDSAGRIVSREISDIDDPSNNRTITFNYEGNNLVSKVSSSGAQDTHVYDNAGRVISSQRHWDGLHEYDYDSSGRLVSSRGSDFVGTCDDDDLTTTIDGNQMESLSYTYQGDLLSRVKGQFYTLDIAYTDRGRINKLIETCRESVEYNTVFSYNDINQLTKFEDFEIDKEFDLVFDNSITNINYNDEGLIESLETIDDSGTSTITITHTPEGYPLTQDLVNTEQSSTFFVIRDYSIMFDYEDASCQIAFSANPTLIPFLDVSLQGRNFNTPLDCVYQFDQGDL